LANTDQRSQRCKDHAGFISLYWIGSAFSYFSAIDMCKGKSTAILIPWERSAETWVDISTEKITIARHKPNWSQKSS